MAMTNAMTPARLFASCPTWWNKHGAADARERHRRQAHLARVADEQHERQDDDRRPRSRRST